MLIALIFLWLPGMACKREKLFANSWIARDPGADVFSSAGEVLFKYIVARFVCGRSTADEVCTLADLVASSRGKGLQSLDIGDDKANVMNNASRTTIPSSPGHEGRAIIFATHLFLFLSRSLSL